MRLSTQSEFVIQCRLTLPQATQSRDLMLPPQYAKIKMEKKRKKSLSRDGEMTMPKNSNRN